MSGSWEQEPSKPFLILALPNTGTCAFSWAMAFKQLEIPPRTLFSTSRGGPIDYSRNFLVSKLYEYDADWIMFLDTDVICTQPDAIFRLLNRNLPLISGAYFRRFHPLVPCFGRIIEENGKKRNVAITDYRIGELLEADTCGSGFLLVHRRVFEAIEQKFGKHIELRRDESGNVTPHFLQPFFKYTIGYDDPIYGGTSEDFYFIQKCKLAGFKLYIATDVLLQHVFDGTIDWEGRVLPTTV